MQALALSGYSPVSLHSTGAWSKGDPALTAMFDGKTYSFVNDAERQMFTADPARYVPVLGGDCVVAYAQHGQRVPGSVQHASVHAGRLYLFSTPDARQMFAANAASFVDADLAYGGNCVVCAVGMGQAMPGRPEITTVHKGLRYRFPSPDQQREFLANPAKYEATGASRPQVAPTTGPSGSSTRPPVPPPAGSGSGSR
jgi:YHS domain-containing protein